MRGDIMRKYLALAILLSIFFISAKVKAQVHARMLRFPDVSQTQITFVYAGNIWVVSKKGGIAHRLSSPKGEEMFPRFSPDGSEIAFSGNYNGNTDIYMIPTMGGSPVRITHHPMPDRMLGWYPDGKHLLYASMMKSGRMRFNQLYEVSNNGGLAQKLPVPYGEFGSISSDGTMLAYMPKSRDFRHWKGYRGGWAPDIWLFNLKTYKSENITDSPANDSQPMWHGNMLYFISDRGPNQRYNIWAYDLNSKTMRQVTHFNQFDIHFPAIGPSDIVFEAGDQLYLLDLKTEKTHVIAINVVTDNATLLPHDVKVSKLIRNVDISPNGKRAVFQARGDIFTVPAEHGVIHDLTQSSGAAERSPAWSPDGKHIAYWSDASGEYQLTIRNEDGSAEPQPLTHFKSGFRYHLYWSPDSKKLAFIDNKMEIQIYNMDNGQLTTVDQGMWMYQGALNAFKVGWSPDSRWLAYYHGLDNRHDAIFIYDTKTGSKHQVTSGFYNDRDPVFDPDGKYLYYLTNRTFKPNYSSIDGTWIYPNSTNIAAVALTPDINSPLAPRNDEVKSEETEKENGKKEEKRKDAKETKPVEIQLDGFENRSVILPIKAGNYRNLEAVSGKVLFQRLPRTGSDNSHGSLNFFNLKERKEETILDKISGYKLSANGKKILAWMDHSFAIVDIAPKQKMEKKLDTGDLEMTVDPRAEWKQIFNDDWRFYRDYFYDPNMHGVNWEAIRKKYQPLVDDAVTRWDVNYVLGEMNAELNSSHTYDFGGDQQQAKHRGVGVLGVNWKIDHGFYQIANIIQGASWDAEVRSPLDQPGVNIKEGDYILAVNGNPIDAAKDPWAAFQGLAGKTVILTVNDQPTTKGARQVLIKTLKSDSRLRHLAWIEQNREMVDKATNGQIGYIYVPNTGIDGQNELVRQFNAQFDKKGLIIDERFNSGGQIPDRFIELLDRPALGFWAVRNGKDLQSPQIANFGPKVMLINGWSGSGGDAFPYFFRERKLGPLVGMRTWGGLIGYTGVPGLIDGGIVTVPSFRMYNTEGKWFPEGHGVDPDYKVVDNPTLMAKGQDPQLEKAIQIEMQQLKEHPPVQPKHPPYQNRAVGKQN